MKQFKEVSMKIVFLLTALISIVAVLLICVFLFANGCPAIGEIGVLNFLFGDTWKPLQDIYGIFPMIIGKYLRHSGRDYHRRTDWAALRSLYGEILPEKAI